MAVFRIEDNATLVSAYLNKLPEPRAAIARLNQEEIPWLRLPPLGLGRKITMPPVLGRNKGGMLELHKHNMTMKLRNLGGWITVDTDVLALSDMDVFDYLIQDLNFQLNSLSKTWGYMAQHRNYYLPDSFEIFVRGTDYVNRVSIGWKVHYVTMPRSWRRKMWKLRNL